MIYIIIHLSKSIECTTPRVNPNINYNFHWLLCVNVGSSLVKKRATGEQCCWCCWWRGCVCVGLWAYKVLVLLLQLFCRLVTSLKHWKREISGILLLWIYPQEIIEQIYKDVCIKLFVMIMFVIVKSWQQPDFSKSVL